jgi:subtilisin family serine protease
MKARLLLATAVAVALPSAAQAASPERLIVRYKPYTTAVEQTAARHSASVTLMHKLHFTPNTDVVIADRAEKARLLANPHVAQVSTDAVVSIPKGENLVAAATGAAGASASNDPYYGLLWALENTGQYVNGSYGTFDADIDGAEAWARSTGSGATVYVADTGIDYTHPDLAANYAGGYDFVDGDSDPMDEHYHGTHVSGTIAAAYNNGVGVAGVAPNAKIVMLRVLDANGQGYFSDTIDAVNYAGQRGARIFSASLGGAPDPGTTQLMCSTIASYPNTLFTFAAGNGGSDGIGDNNDVTPNYPSNCGSQNVIGVAASTQTDGRATFSNYGKNSVDVAAPGTSIYSTIPHGWLCGGVPSIYCYLDGTSMATPQVAGEAALLVAKHPSWSADLIRARIFQTVDPKPAWSGLVSTGGRINANAALLAPPPAPSITSAPVALTNSTSASFAFSDAQPGVGFRCQLDRGPATPCSSPQIYTGLGDASHTFAVSAVDGDLVSGNTSASWTVDTAPPLVSLLSTPPAVTTSTSASFVFSAEAGARFQCKLDAASFAPCTSPTTYSGLTKGGHGFQLRAVDAAGNVSTVSAVTSTIVAPSASDVIKPRLSGVRLSGGGFPVTVYWSQDRVATATVTLARLVRGRYVTAKTITLRSASKGTHATKVKRGTLKTGKYRITVKLTNKAGSVSTTAGYKTIH